MKKPSNLRRAAMLEALGWLEYRAVVCRVEEERHPMTSLARATERSARHELELAIREIAKLANMPKHSKAYRAAEAERLSFIAANGTQASPPPARGRADADGRQGGGS